MKYRILVDAPGQTCNRFFAYLDTVAWAVANRGRVVIFHWDSSLHHYNALRCNRWVSFPFYKSWLFNLIGEKRCQDLLRMILDNRLTRRIFSLGLVRSLGFYNSWQLRMRHEYFPYMKTELRPLFRPNEDICQRIEHTMAKYKSEGYFVIGVHIRRGDYKTFMDGKYFYELEDYAVTMHSLVSLYDDRRVMFFISTNEQYDPMVFSGLSLCQFENTTVAHDLYTLSLCDRIIGPLSTFSRWASWYGSVPLKFIDKAETNLTDGDFSVIHDFYHFENGAEIVNLSDR